MEKFRRVGKMGKRNFSKRVSYRTSDAMSKFVLAQDPETISFAGGLPDNNLFPVEELKHAYEEVLRTEGNLAFQYTSTCGDTKLRELVGENLFKKWNKTIPSDNIVLTEGSQQALDLLGKLFLDDGDIALIEEPGYLGTIQAWSMYSDKLIGIPQDEYGIDIDYLEEKLKELKDPVKVLYIVPDFSNPAGTCLAIQRRIKLIELSEKYNFFIVEDLAYSLLSYDHDTYPPLVTLSNSNKIITIGSFSKILSPGLRTGFIIAPKEITQMITRLKEGTDLCSGTLNQKLIYQFYKLGYLEKHVEKLKVAYRTKRDSLKKALDEKFKDIAKWNFPQGGFFFFLVFPEWVDAYKLAETALEQKTSFVPGEEFFVSKKGKNTARISFSQVSPEKMAEGIKRLHIAWELYKEKEEVFL
jgi:2-aminoadipate transaminase